MVAALLRRTPAHELTAAVTMAGALAARARVGRALLTHFFTPYHAVKESVAAAAKEFGAVLAVDEGSTYGV